MALSVPTAVSSEAQMKVESDGSEEDAVWKPRAEARNTQYLTLQDGGTTVMVPGKSWFQQKDLGKPVTPGMPETTCNVLFSRSKENFEQKAT